MILQTTLPYDPDDPPRLPGIAPLAPGDWLLLDEAYGPQVALRRHLLETRRAEVLAVEPGAEPAAAELLETVLAQLPEGVDLRDGVVRCPDGARVPVERSDPLGTLGRILQEDFCLMERRGEQHVLTGAVLCFPASWTLSEKLGHPLTRIHAPVENYDADLARRVQRLFDGIRPGRPLWRFNALGYDDPALFQPRREAAPHAAHDRGAARYLRSERQCLWRLERSGAVVFSIHTYVLDRRAGLSAPPAGPVPADGRY
ncbi:heme-dependent oxidative N-demethylase family protein [Pseudoponticoccus marisrubri]|uniref:DUF3445 domain-containing protein n=1 Tax=Pseudoponticoccus marisrubri TaxID=1685382 RepID=A0A0W7WEL5_9RHOB|nr:DUF3445 domain-containing protein [Pseudoponticoccus marisrubri]KUF09005.1 hypothetical protein AVJ23_19605 [Pseudoponticoccus marisrubri]